jgi:DNA/RNA endonuclease YhcR with UshA esterase domain
MNEINLHDVEQILVTDRRDFNGFSAMTIRIVTGLGNLDVVLFSHDPETLTIQHISEEQE